MLALAVPALATTPGKGVHQVGTTQKVWGTASSSTVSDTAVVRFKPGGTLDTSVAADFNGFGDFGHALAIDAQGQIVAAGTGAGQFALLRAFL